jgi:hypothetical protein
MLGQQLQAAKADCDAALKKGLRNSEVLDSRGAAMEIDADVAASFQRLGLVDE